MSRWDEYDRMFERIEQGRRDIAENNSRAAIAPNEDVVTNWNEKIEEVTSLIETGVLETEEWCVSNSNWVEFKTGGFRGRSLNVSRIITENRVLKYLSNYGLSVTEAELTNLMSNIKSLNADDSKKFLKKYILQRKMSPCKSDNKKLNLYSEQIQSDTVSIQKEQKASKKNTLVSKIVTVLFGR
ncbi:hypothetical protein [Alteromonas stellipolaris]|uniref:hypothetical protein n=1 Tax=Alteromonas stellipolaris TaxID=233316 RepID=UPI0026E27449|nr:hypothetical protein [Alteromonas stellipolaris]MDO6536258.1 hypothetical protein [Alteromonas stellipolaris]MDO6627793.1 hypothetical protein [Alteromonas stellipolaris]